MITVEDADVKSLPMISKKNRKSWLLASVSLLAIPASYHPVWHGCMLWDDEDHVTRPELRSWRRLDRIWFGVHSLLGS